MNIINSISELPINREIISGVEKKGAVTLVLSQEEAKLMVVFKLLDEFQKTVFILAASSVPGTSLLSIQSRLNAMGYSFLLANEARNEYPIYKSDPVLIGAIYSGVSAKGGKSEAKDNFTALIREATKQKVSDIHAVLTDIKCEVFFDINKRLTRYGINLYTRDMFHAMISSMYNTEADTSSKDKNDFSVNIMQEAKINVLVDERNIEIRYQSIPINNGTKITLRILANNEKQVFSLSNFGYQDTQINLLRSNLAKKNGLNLIVGETGSGKTTTAHAMLHEILLLNEGIAIHSVEDPIEIVNHKIFQSPLIPLEGESKSDAYVRHLHTLLRSAPSVIFQGEIRSKEQAQVSAEAVLSGHGVLSTLHTQGVIETILRLLKLGVDTQTLGSKSFLNSITYQGLFGKLCPHCSTSLSKVHDEQMYNNLLEILKLKKNFISGNIDNVKVRNKDGCEHCVSGLAGKVLCAEVMIFDNQSKRLVGQEDMIGLERYWKYEQNIGSKQGEYKGKDFFDHTITNILNGVLCPYMAQTQTGDYDMEIINLKESLLG